MRPNTPNHAGRPRALRERTMNQCALHTRLALTTAGLWLATVVAAEKPIYQCNERAFTDGGCDANRAGQPVDSGAPLSLYTAPKPDHGNNVQPAAKPRSSNRRKAQTDPCASIRTALAQLKTRRRRGYSSDTEARLDAREAALRRQQRDVCMAPTVRATTG